ncbi:MAG: hypothetical protein ACTSU5_13410 [Promethearchaeota archaeon]
MARKGIKGKIATAILFTLVLGPLVAGTTMVSAVPGSGTGNYRALLPKDSMLENFIHNFPDVIEYMEKATIDGSPVYYLSYSVVAPDQPVTHEDAEHGYYNYTTTEIKDFFSNAWNNLTGWNASLWEMYGPLHDYSYPSSADSWSYRDWKLNVTKEIYAWMNSTQSSGYILDTAGMDTFVGDLSWYTNGDYASATPEEVFWWLNRNVTPMGMFNSMYYHELAKIPSHSILDLNCSYLVNQTLPLMTGAKTELDWPANEELSIWYNISVNVDEKIDVDNKAVVIMWDPDDSVMTQVNRLKNGQLPNAQAFTGNEVFYLVHFLTMNRTLWGNVDIDVTWNYTQNGVPVNSSPKFYEFMHEYRFSPRFLDWVSSSSDIPIYLLRRFVRPSYHVSVPESDPKTFRQGTFDLGCLKVNAFELHFANGGFGTPSDVKIDLAYSQHHWLGLSVFNDTNGNGYQDVEVKGTAPFLYTETNETAYRFRAFTVENRTYTAPTVVNNSLVFGIDFNNIDGELVPIDSAEEDKLLENSTTSDMPEHIDKTSFQFNFSVDTANKSASMKVDYMFGDFENQSGAVDPKLDGYSLAMNTMFMAFRYRAGMRTFNSSTRISGDGNTTLSDPERVRRMRQFRFSSGDTVQFENRLDDIPYNWGTSGEAVTAIGQLVPLKLGQVSMGRATMDGNKTVAMGQSISGGVFLYSISYPKWSGQQIVHDPVFTTYVDDLGSAGSSWLSGNLKWILIAAGAIAVVIVVFALVRRSRASSYPGFGTGNRKTEPSKTDESREGDKARPGGRGWELLSSFFFTLDDSGTRLDRRDRWVFELFTGFLSLNVLRYTNRPDNAWELAATLTPDAGRWTDEANLELLNAMFRPPMYDPSRLQFEGTSGRLYVFAGDGADAPALLVDVYLFAPETGTYRVYFAFANQPTLPPGKNWEAVVSVVATLLRGLETTAQRASQAGETLETAAVGSSILGFLGERFPLDLGRPHAALTKRAQEKVEQISSLPEIAGEKPISDEEVEVITLDVASLPPERVEGLADEFGQDYLSLYEKSKQRKERKERRQYETK